MNRFQRWLNKIMSPEQRSITYAESLPIWEHNQRESYSWDIERAVTEGYKASSIVYLCVKKKANSTASVPFRLYQQIDDTTVEEVRDGELVSLLKHPNEFQTQSKLIWRWSAHLSLGGNTTVSKVRVGSKPKQLWALLPKDIYPVKHNDQFIKHYEYIRGTYLIYILPEDLIHDQLPNPASPFWGVGELQALAASVDSEVYTQRLISNSMQNRGMPSGVVSIKGAATQAQYEKAKELVKHEIIGPANAGKVLVIDKDIDYKQLTQSMEELKVIEAHRMSREDIAMGFEIDPIILGFNTSATFANKQWARFTYWVDTIMPWCNAIADELTQGLVHEFYPNAGQDEFFVAPDFSKVEALSTMYKERAQIASVLIGAGFEPEDVAEKLDLNMRIKKVQPVPAAFQDNQDNVDNEDNEEDEDTLDNQDEQRGIRRITNRVDYWTRADNKRLAFERDVAEQIAAVFARFGGEVAEGYREYGATAVYEAMARERQYWRLVLSAVYRAGAESFGEDVYRELFSQGAPAMWRRQADLLAQEFAPVRTDLINDSSVNAVRALLADAEAAGLESTLTADALEELYARWQRARTMTIATSEVGLVMGESQFQMGRLIEAGGDPLVKEWISRQDGIVRPSHLAIDGEVRELEQPFSNGLRYPGDPSGDPSETINCRCVVGYQLKEAL
jgi:HK97 family phage portal protein